MKFSMHVLFALFLCLLAAGLNNSGSTGSWIFIPANRSYPSVTANITGEDFIALLMGEVSGNWVDLGSRLMIEPPAMPLYLRRSSASPMLSGQSFAAVPPAAEPQK